MARWTRIGGAGGAVLAALAASGCASTRPAPIVFAGAGAPDPAVGASAPAPEPLAVPFDASALPMIVGGLPYSECAPYARQVSGVAIRGDAVTWWAQAAGRYAQSSRPAEGSVLVLDGYGDKTRGHVSVVKAIVGERIIRVDHANWMGQGEVSVNVPVLDVSAANDWSQVRVWHIPGGHWGGRVYQARGFIHPFRLDGGAGLSG